MTIAENFRNEWHMMDSIDYEREKLLNKEHREVYHEQIYQECQEGIKTQREIAEEFGVHKSTVCRIAIGKGLNR